MPYNLDENNDNFDGTAVGGVLGAVPLVNIFAPGIEAALTNDSATKTRQAMVNNAAGMPLPQFSQQGFVGPDYAGDFSPAMYQTPESAQANLINVDPATRNVEMQALQKLVEQGNGAADAQNAAAQFHALDAANQLANARQGAIRQEMEARGQGGTGLNAMMQAQAAQQAANRAQSGTLDAVSQAALMKLAALGQAGNMAGAVRGQDFQNAAANSDILNRFNMFNVAARNAANQANVGLQNEAGMYNQGNRQQILNGRAAARNASLSRNDQNQMNMFGANTQRTGMVNSALGGKAQQANTSNDQGMEAGKTGFSNYKDLMSMFGGMA